MSILDPVLAQTYQDQIARECSNWAAYTALANRCQSLDLDGFATFFHASAGAKLRQAQKLRDFLLSRHVEPQTAATNGYTAPLTPDLISAGTILFSEALRLEMANTEAIKFAYSMAEELHDQQSYHVLMCLIEEQTKAECELARLVSLAKFAEGCAAAVLELDHEFKE